MYSKSYSRIFFFTEFECTYIISFSVDILNVSNDILFLVEDDVVSMADSTITVDDIEGELFKIDRIRDVLVRRESELRYM